MNPLEDSSDRRSSCTVTLTLLAMACLTAGVYATIEASPPKRNARPGVAERLPWHGQGVWLQGDIHLHRVMRKNEGEIIAAAAASSKLDFIATSEHSQHAIEGKNTNRLLELRRKFTGMIILAGIEWNVPGAGHASVIVEETDEEWGLLEHFTNKFDRKVSRDMRDDEPEHGDATWGSLKRAREGLRWLKHQGDRGGPQSVVYLNHPSRHHYVTDANIAGLRAAGLDGVEGAAGHQLREPPGTKDSIDRHEPYVAVVGGGYDRLLADGDFLGLTAGSDFHITDSSYLPGFYSRSLVYAPDRTPAGVIQGLAAGCTATVVGKIVKSVETRTTYKGLEDHAMISEVLNVPRGKRVTYTIEFDVPRLDFEREDNRIDQVEIISNWQGQPAIVETLEDIGDGPVTLVYELPAEATAEAGRFFLRARGRRFVGADGNDLANADLLFYTGGTRVRVLD